MNDIPVAINVEANAVLQAIVPFSIVVIAFACPLHMALPVPVDEE
jgi:hypothetical protein